MSSAQITVDCQSSVHGDPEAIKAALKDAQAKHKEVSRVGRDFMLFISSTSPCSPAGMQQWICERSAQIAVSCGSSLMPHLFALIFEPGMSSFIPYVILVQNSMA